MLCLQDAPAGSEEAVLAAGADFAVEVDEFVTCEDMSWDTGCVLGGATGVVAGDAGEAGVAGVAGVAGEEGVAGVAGVAGTAGVAGVSGAPWPSEPP